MDHEQVSIGQSASCPVSALVSCAFTLLLASRARLLKPSIVTSFFAGVGAWLACSSCARVLNAPPSVSSVPAVFVQGGNSGGTGAADPFPPPAGEGLSSISRLGAFSQLNVAQDFGVDAAWPMGGARAFRSEATAKLEPSSLP